MLAVCTTFVKQNRNLSISIPAMKYFFSFIFLLFSMSLTAQNPKQWDLRTCVEYAIKHNISVQQADIQARLSKLQADQAKYNQLPTMSGSSGLGMRLGRSIDPVTNAFTTTQFLYNNFGANGGIQVYNNNRLSNTAAATNFSWLASIADLQTAANDISVNVATFYLQILSTIEQSEIAKIQIAQTNEQLAATKKRVEVGLLPEINLLELETQLANDSSNYITAISNVEQSKLSLKALLNLDASEVFDVYVQPVDQIKLQSFADLQPDYVFGVAEQNLPNIKAANLRLKAAEKNQLVAKAGFYPTLSFGYSLSSNFSNSFKYISGIESAGFSNISPNSPFVTVGSAKYYVQSPVYNTITANRDFSNIWKGWGKQLDNNFGQNFGLQLSIPIFNANQSKTAYQQSKLNYQSVSLQQENTQRKLKQDIYAAYTNAVVAFNKLNANQKAVTSAEKAYSFATKRYELGLLGTIELLNNQNNFLKAKVNYKAAQYEYVFRIKLLEFYKGEALSL
jgi:outer membrane protein